MTKFFRNNGLTVVLLTLFAVSALGHWLAGWHVHNAELARQGEASITLLDYASDPHFIATVFENWESEFLQMATYVVLTAFLFQKGSSESKDPDAAPRDDHLEVKALEPGAPGALRAGPVIRWLYVHSLGIALLVLFAASFVLHWIYSAKEAAAAATSHGELPLSLFEYLASAQLWFESFQNWQSEFLSTAALVVLSIFLRQRESPESKPVAAPHSKTGSE